MIRQPGLLPRKALGDGQSLPRSSSGVDVAGLRCLSLLGHRHRARHDVRHDHRRVCHGRYVERQEHDDGDGVGDGVGNGVRVRVR